jgi:anti-anti-sigma regulatory factor
MIDLLLSFGVLVIMSGLGGFVAARAWSYPPARVFLGVAGILATQRIVDIVQFVPSSSDVLLRAAALKIILLALLSLAMLVLIAALFTPAWFESRRPMNGIAAPYLLLTLLITADLALGLGVFFTTDASAQIVPVRPQATVLLVLLTLGFVVQIVVLGVSFARQPALRWPSGVLLGMFVVSLVIGLTGVGAGSLDTIVCASLAYVVLRSHLLVPKRVGIDAAVQSMDDMLVVLDGEEVVRFTNPTGADHDVRLGLPLPASLATAQEHVTLGQRQFQLRRTALAEQRSGASGSLLFGRDVTDLEARTQQLNAERVRLAALDEQLRHEQAERTQLADTLRAVELPVIPALPGVVIMPIIGTLEGRRSQEFVSALLTSIERERASVVLLDITGASLLDAAGAQNLVAAAQAARLLGARTVLVGVRPEIAQSLVSLGGLENIETSATLQQALQAELTARHVRG